MLKIQILSDLHLEFDLPQGIPHVEADLVVLAGDIHNGGAGIKWACRTFSPDIPIVYVPGNHEYYGRSIHQARHEMEQAATAIPKRVRLLNPGELILHDLGVRVLGATLWTDFALFGHSEIDLHESLDACERYMTDFTGAIRISNKDGTLRRFTPNDALAMHQIDLGWLMQKLAKPFAGKTIVVTHHAPHPNSLADRFAFDRVSAGFINDLSSLMGPVIDLWFHGHTHDGFDYEVNGTRVVCNPRGYVNRPNGKPENPAFDWSRIVYV